MQIATPGGLAYTRPSRKSVPRASELCLSQAPGPSVLGPLHKLFPAPGYTLTQHSVFLPLTQCYSFLKAHSKCYFLQGVFPNPSQQGHISPCWSLSSAVFAFNKGALYHSCWCFALVRFPLLELPSEREPGGVHHCALS